MRDKLFHGYFSVDVYRVWLTAIQDLPLFKRAIIRILGQLPDLVPLETGNT